ARSLSEHGDRRPVVPPDLQGPVGQQRDVIAIVRGLLAQIQLRNRRAGIHYLRGDAAVGAGESLDGGLVARVGIGLRARARQPGAGDDAPAGTQSRGAVEGIGEDHHWRTALRWTRIRWTRIRRTRIRRTRIRWTRIGR